MKPYAAIAPLDIREKASTTVQQRYNVTEVVEPVFAGAITKVSAITSTPILLGKNMGSRLGVGVTANPPCFVIRKTGRK